jgi:osmotically-inducible protein OsmY
VTEVRNEIVVAAAKRETRQAIDATERAGEHGADATAGATQNAGEKAKEIAGTAAKKAEEVASSTGEAITDGWITTKLKAKFFDETLLRGSDIHVETDDRMVTLKGTVAWSAAKARAVTIASGTEGVTRVVDQLVVKGK